MHLRTGSAFNPSRGLTLVELLVVVLIVSVLLGILLPAVNRARSAAQRSVCLANMRQLELAHNLYITENDGWLLPTSHTTSWIDILREYDGNLATRSPVDTSPHFEHEGVVVPATGRFRRTSYSINFRLASDRVSTGPGDPAFQTINDLRSPATVVHASIKVFQGDHASSDHFHPRAWAHTQHVLVGALAAGELQTNAHGEITEFLNVSSTYGFPDGHAEITRFQTLYPDPSSGIPHDFEPQ